MTFIRKSHQSHDIIDIIDQNRNFQINLRRSKVARRLVLRVSRSTGKISLTLPENYPLEAAKAFILKNKGWMEVRKSHIPPKIPFSNLAIIPIRGKQYQIIKKNGRGISHLEEHTENPSLIVYCEEKHVSRRVKDFLKKNARHDLAQAVQKYTQRIGKPAKRITLKDTQSRWGSCSSKGFLNFSWRLILAPPFVLDYLAAHEVAHLVEMNHSQRFWKLTRSLCADTDQAERWLKEYGSTLHRYGD